MQARYELEPDRATGALASALTREIDMTRDDAVEIASHVLAAFAGRDELDDDDLSPDLRSIFYTLEGQRLLSFRREEYRSEEGHLRRAFFWRIRWENIGGLPEQDRETEPAQKLTVYEELPRDAWTRA